MRARHRPSRAYHQRADVARVRAYIINPFSSLILSRRAPRCPPSALRVSACHPPPAACVRPPPPPSACPYASLLPPASALLRVSACASLLPPAFVRRPPACAPRACLRPPHEWPALLRRCSSGGTPPGAFWAFWAFGGVLGRCAALFKSVFFYAENVLKGLFVTSADIRGRS